ncbi:glycosyl transferase family 1 [Winogradskyella pacifica]|uniref:Glycosyl transferase family 1 n=1 Tax=Winogradskyella pacifica TaxID=664642 RepID=A0A3D9N6F6_9FLAO|nr:glycosyltransferase [Winogradskyella pacifica]REE27445.1 glycosyl transferase family 1 [Winogradskyella pacifica]
MKVLYIGQFSEGTTSKMRAKTIEKILKPNVFQVIDTHVPFFKSNKLFRSFGFRYKIGPLIAVINKFVIKELKASYFDLIWIDKGVFLTAKTTKLLRKRADKLVHFTPDMAFYGNQSRLFNQSVPYFDYVITTKSKELQLYERIIPKEKILLTTQGFDKQIHKPYHTFEQKDNAIVFIGLAEPSRLKIAEQIINQNLTLKLVGKGWEAFVEKHKGNENLKFIGDAVYSSEYSKLISSSKFGLGLLSKNFPELHTTRTFEIPACGTALLTERNAETRLFYKDDEVVFYENQEDLIEKIFYFIKNQAELKNVIASGRNTVLNGNYDYESIIKELLNLILK